MRASSLTNSSFSFFFSTLVKIIMTFIALVGTIFGIVVCLGLLVWAAISDFRSLKIPNIISVAGLGAFGVAFLASQLGDNAVFQTVLAHLSAGLIMLLVSVLFYAFGVMGAGDSKLATVLGIWVGLKGLAAFVFWMSLIGGLVGLATVLIRKIKPFSKPIQGGWIDEVQKGRNVVPYGIALAGGAILSFLWLGYFDIPLIVSKISHS